MAKIKDRVSKLPPFTEDLPKEIQDVLPKDEVKEEPEVDIKEMANSTTEMVEKLKEEVAEPKVEGAETKEEPKTDEKKDRTKKQFKKLTKSSKKLKKENDKLKDEARRFSKEGPVASLMPDVPDTPKAPKFNWDKMLTKTPPPAQQFSNLSQKEVKDVMANITDEDGYVNTDLLKDELNKANSVAQQAQRSAQMAMEEAKKSKRQFDDFQRTEIARKVHKDFPELDPDNSDVEFNAPYWEAVRNQVLANLTSGKQEGFYDAAEKLKSRYAMKKAEKKEVKEQQDSIRQINASGTKAKAQTRTPFGEKDTLVKATRAGEKGALGERLKRAGL